MANTKQAVAAYILSLGNNQAPLSEEVMQHLHGLAAFLGGSAATQATSAAGPKRPKAGTLTGQVWDICDELAKAGPVSRKQVIQVGTSKGLQLATITTQYQAWRSAQAAVAAAQAAAAAKAAAEQAEAGVGGA